MYIYESICRLSITQKYVWSTKAKAETYVQPMCVFVHTHGALWLGLGCMGSAPTQEHSVIEQDLGLYILALLLSSCY